MAPMDPTGYFELAQIQWNAVECDKIKKIATNLDLNY